MKTANPSQPPKYTHVRLKFPRTFHGRMEFMSKNVKRLFNYFVPKNYTIQLDPDREAATVSGTVTVSGRKADRPSKRFTFHQHGLTITAATIFKKDKKGEREVPVTRINHHRSSDEVRLHVDELLYPGEYVISMTFHGDITRPMDGIYPCFFKHDGAEKKLIATQFESHHAREAFPCIDEPEAKATFDLTLLSPTGEAVVSNTPVKLQRELDGKLATTFQTTPHMSTYLLAFVYGELAYREKKTKHGVTLRTYATPDNVEFTTFALDVAAKVLDFFSEYFDIPYPLPKCDLIALPDFAAGAMENWGCITFREQALFVDPSNTSLSSKQYVAMVVAHELTHQWFGNLVTMRWWTDLWLNEGFANWMEYFATDHLFPEWNMWTQYIVDEQQLALKLDALENTHPIEVPIHHPDEIRTIFDTISYSKGGSTIQMLAEYLGHEAFQGGLRYYLKKHAYGNTDTVDLWDALEHVSKKPVKAFMHSWTSSAGYPLVRAEVSDGQATLDQQLFTLNPKSALRDQPLTPWPVPLHASAADQSIFDTPHTTVPVQSPDTFKLNHQQSGFYRAIYDQPHLQRLAKHVKNKKMGPIDRLGLLADAFEAAKAGFLDTTAALAFMETYQAEDNSAVWDVMVANLAGIRAVMNDEDLRQTMKPYARDLAAAQLKRLGWEEHKGESHFDRLLRPTILALAAVSDEPHVVAEALRRFADMKKPEDLQPDLRSVVYVTAARKGDTHTFERLLHMHHATASSEERITLAAALTSFHQPELVDRALALITTDNVRLQDVMYWVAYSFSNRFARDKTWKWLVANWAWLKENLGTDLAFYRMPVYSARAFSNESFLPTYKKFFESVMEPALDRSTKQGIEIIEWQSQWRKRDLAAIKTYFANR